MKTKTKLAVLSTLIHWIIVIPTVWILQYLILDHIHATFWMWVLYWLQMPAGMLVAAIVKFLEVIYGKNFEDDEFVE